MHSFDLILMLAIGFSAALIFGYITQRLGLSPILGYLLAGIVVGPFTPGFVAHAELAGQLAEFGVILLMFGVGLHFHLKDLIAVRKIAIPGAVGQIVTATVLGALVATFWGWSLGSGIILGVAISVASTVVLTRVLMDNNVLDSPQGHIAVGWLIVEDIFTVLVLVLLPAFASSVNAENGGSNIFLALGSAVLKLVVLSAIVLVAGKRAIPWLLTQVARTRSRELFTLTVLALALAIASGSAIIFGASFALGAFLAGMVVGQSKAGLQAAADALPMRDAFAVLFFISVGMLFDPSFLIANPGLIVAVLAIILIAKPFIALVLVILLGYSVRTAITVALALSQIGEFSFILSSTALNLGLFSQDGQNALIAAALITISVNPLLFRASTGIEKWLRGRPALWKLLHKRADARAKKSNIDAIAKLSTEDETNRAIVIGYGPVGQTVTRILEDFGIHPVVVELNIDTVDRLNTQGITSIYGDAARPEILTAAGVVQAKFLIITIPDLLSRIPVISIARELNDSIVILVRARYLAERVMLEDLGATSVCYEEAEAAVGLSEFLLRAVGVEERLIQAESGKIRAELTE
ncbi:MAG: cation:proton antiporter [candidate division Zixibacteria bacterium]|nr:cation:proton antiporter [candidate division Zixibacteria bacterium]